MAARPYWKGYLKLSLVTCAVALSPATSDSERVRFHTLNRKTGDRIFSRYLDAETGKVVDAEDQVRGYEKAENDFVALEDEELDAVKLESARTIDVEMFVPHDSVEWVFFDTPYFLTPTDEVGEEAYSVIRAAMVSTRTCGIARLVVAGRERAVMIEPRDNGMVLWTLRFADEVRPETEYWKSVHEKPDEDAMPLIERLIEARTQKWSAAMVKDPVQDKLLGLIRSRQAKSSKAPKPKGAAPAAAPQSNVVNLMEALKRSMAEQPKKKRSSR